MPSFTLCQPGPGRAPTGTGILIWADVQLDRYCDFWVGSSDFPHSYAHQTKTRHQTETQNQIFESKSAPVIDTHIRGARPNPAPLPSPGWLGWVGSGVLRGLRGMMMSSTRTPSSACFSATWERSSDRLGEKRLQHLHMKMARLSVRKNLFIVTEAMSPSSRLRKIVRAALLSYRQPPTDDVSLVAT